MTNETKVYSIRLKNSSHSYALVHVQSDQFHGVHCLKGTARTVTDHAWMEGKRIYIPVAEIAAITEFDSWNDFLAACKTTNGAGMKASPPAAMKKTKAKKAGKSKKRR